jgi:WXXGXW repeat (2 copies)
MKPLAPLMLALGLAACVAGIGGEGGPVTAAPAALAELPSLAPAPGMVWVAGSWHWNDHGWVWIPGRWESAPPPAAVP